MEVLETLLACSLKTYAIIKHTQSQNRPQKHTKLYIGQINTYKIVWLDSYISKTRNIKYKCRDLFHSLNRNRNVSSRYERKSGKT